MTTIDIRTADLNPVTEIRCAAASPDFYVADVVERHSDGACLKDSQSGRTMRIRDKEHAGYLRKALDKAEELGWLK